MQKSKRFLYFLLGDYKHWTRDQRARDLRIRGPKDQGPRRPSCVALSFYDRNATCINVLSSNVQLCRWSHRVRIVIHTKDALHTRLCYFTLSASFLYPFFTLQNPRIVFFIACKTTERD